MAPERLHQISELFHAALELKDDRRVEFLKQACGSDESLYREIESLLSFENRTAFIDAAATELATWPLEDEGLIAARLPADIGRYRILGVLGEGGMGFVYEAQQEQPRRAVALKVIRPGLASPELLRRFGREAQALARLQHPGIAQIYEAGTADTGFGPQPFFAMELVRGHSLRDYAEKHSLQTRQRLELMVKICEGVQHAHQRGLIHRDLKPGNILVDETGQPKILDFGVARVTDTDVESTRQTGLGQIVGTLAYMSPEQVLADPLELDTRSDVYALGVILYELLSGRLPYELHSHPHEAARIIREEDPAPLSSISRFYRGDIETIAAKALQKDKARRYASASGLAADIQRYLNNEPIAARPASASYQFRKFARRNRALVSGVAAVFIVLIGGVIASTWEATRARRAEQTADAVNNFLRNDLLAQASANTQARPDTKPDPELKVRTVLDRAAKGITGKFDSQPLVEASIRTTIGNAYRDLGLYSDAQPQMERALDVRKRALGEEATDTLATIHDLGVLCLNEGKYAQAEQLLTKALEGRRRVLGSEHPDTLNSLDELGYLYLKRGDYVQAEPLVVKALEARRRVLGAEHLNTLESMNQLVLLYWREGKFHSAEPFAISVLQARRHMLGEEHPRTQGAINNLALLYLNEGQYLKAEPLFTEVMEVDGRVLGKEHEDTLTATNNLASVYMYQGKYVQAEPLFIKVLEVTRRVAGEEHPDTILQMNNLAYLYQDESKYMQAEPLFIEAVELAQRILGEENPQTLGYTNNLAFLYIREGRHSQAEQLLRTALKNFEKTAGSSWSRYNCETLLGASLSGQHRYAEAEPLLLSGYEGMTNRKSTIPVYSRDKLERAAQWIGQLYKDWGKPEQAAQWQKKRLELSGK